MDLKTTLSSRIANDDGEERTELGGMLAQGNGASPCKLLASFAEHLLWPVPCWATKLVPQAIGSMLVCGKA
jgi:hypothetical protein